MRKPRKPIVAFSEAEKARVTDACERLIDDFLKPRFLPSIRPTEFNYPVDILGKWHGANAITDYMKHAHADLGATLHRISNIDIRSVNGGVQARCYVDALLSPMNEGGPLHRGIGYFDDQLIRTANGWQIARRHFHAVLLE